MKFYVTRHGQVLPKSYYVNPQFPAGDQSITELGCEQAKKLGEYMAHIGFKGKIYTSPYIRTLETAEIIADHTGSEIVPWAPMQEICIRKEAAEEFHGLTLEEIRKKFRHISPDCELPYPWWTQEPETLDDVFNRLKKAFEELNPKEDAMFVGHGASLETMNDVLKVPHKGGHPYNCTLTICDTEGRCLYMDDAHLPYKMRTYNPRVIAEEDAQMVAEFIENEYSLPDEIRETSSTKILHIGDTHSFTYPYYKKLIEDVKPDILIHTGDFVDEVKVGRMFNVQEEYEEGVKQLAEIIKNSTAKEVYIVGGNNDVVEIIAKHLPDANIVEPDSVVNICGVECNLGHGHFDATKGAEWSFYGHGLSGEEWSSDKNDTTKGICRFNVIWGSSVILMPERKHFVFKRPAN